MPAALRRLTRQFAALAGVFTTLALAPSLACAAAVIRPPIPVEWAVVVTAFPCDPFAGGSPCAAFESMTGIFGLVGLPSTDTGFAIGGGSGDGDGDPTDERYVPDLVLLAGSSVAFYLGGVYKPKPPPPPSGPIPIPYPIFAFAPGTTLGAGDTAPDEAPSIGLGTLASRAFEPIALTGPIYAFDEALDATAQVGTWEVRLRAASVPEPATLGLLALGLVTLGIGRRQRNRPTVRPL